MKRICDFSRNPATRNYTIKDLQAPKGTGTKLSMANPANNEELLACVEAGIDLFVVGADQIDDVRRLREFRTEVAAQKLPYAQTNVTRLPGEQDRFLEALDKWTPTHR